MTHRKPTNAAVYGIDLGKNVFHVAGAGGDGAIVGNWKFRRDTLLQFFRDAAPALIGMEACPPPGTVANVPSRSRSVPSRPGAFGLWMFLQRLMEALQ